MSLKLAKLPTQELVDTYYALHRQYAAPFKLLENVKKELAKRIPVQNPDEELKLFGSEEDGQVPAIIYTPCAVKHVPACEPSDLWLTLGDKVWHFLDVSVTRAKKLLSAEEFAASFSAVPGARRMKSVQLEAVEVKPDVVVFADVVGTEQTGGTDK